MKYIIYNVTLQVLLYICSPVEMLNADSVELMCFNLNIASTNYEQSIFQRLVKVKESMVKEPLDGKVILLMLPCHSSNCPLVHGTPERNRIVIINDCLSVIFSFLLSCNPSAHHDSDFLFQSPREQRVKTQGHLNTAS